MKARRMKGIEDFFYVLIIALVLIGIFMVISAVWPYSPGGTGLGGIENITVSSFSLGSVGYSENQPISSNLGTFTVGETQEEVLRSVPQLEISSGWFGGSSEEYTITVPSHYRESMRDILVSFNVYDTNQYGNLNVVWNGKNFYNEKVPRSRVVVKIDANYIEDVNTLKISADGPGLAFWASTVYTIREFKTILEYGPSKIIAFSLGQNDIEAFSKGELQFIGFGTSNLRVKVNGYKIWDEVPDGVETVQFNYTDAPLKLGDNILALDCPSGTATLNNAVLNLFVLTNQVTRTRTIDISEGQFVKLDSQGYIGEIRFRIDEINRHGELRIDLNGNRLGAITPKDSWNSVAFGNSDAMEGSNILEFSGTGYWDISDVEVILTK